MLFFLSTQWSFAGGKKENNNTTTTHNNGKTLLNNPKAQAAGAAILSAVTSPQAAGLIQPQQQSMGTNGFNRGELVEFLNMRKWGVEIKWYL